jgi:hypothetical protein
MRVSRSRRLGLRLRLPVLGKVIEPLAHGVSAAVGDGGEWCKGYATRMELCLQLPNIGDARGSVR